MPLDFLNFDLNTVHSSLKINDDEKAALIKMFFSLKGRCLRSEGLLIAEGRILSRDVIGSGLKVHSVLAEERFEKEFIELSKEQFPVLTAKRNVIMDIAGFPFDRGILTAARRPAQITPEEFFKVHLESRSIVVCPKINNEENLGTIIRSAAALNADAVFLGKESNDPFSRRCLKVSMGAGLRFPVVEYDDNSGLMAFLKKQKFTLIAAVCDDDAVSLSEYVKKAGAPGKTALFLGSEDKGLGKEQIDKCDIKLRIPIDKNIDSLNVGVAAGILMHQLFA